MNAHHKTNTTHESDDMLERLFSKIARDFHKYWRLAAVILAVAVVTLLAIQNWTNRRQIELDTTWAALADLNIHPMSSEDELRKIAEECRHLLAERWKTSATPWVLMNLGSAHLKLGEPEAAADTFRRITDRHRKHHAYSIALPNLAAALELEGKHIEAAETFRKAAGEFPATHPSFRIAAGRNLEMAGKRADAIAAYEKAIEETKNIPATGKELEMAEYRLKTLLRDGKLLTAPPEPPPPTPEDMEEIGPDPQPLPDMPDHMHEDAPLLPEEDTGKIDTDTQALPQLPDDIIEEEPSAPHDEAPPTLEEDADDMSEEEPAGEPEETQPE